MASCRQTVKVSQVIKYKYHSLLRAIGQQYCNTFIGNYFHMEMDIMSTVPNVPVLFSQTVE